MDATSILLAWEAQDVAVLGNALADDVVCRGFLPQAVDKRQFIAYIRALKTAFPDLSLNAVFLNEQLISGLRRSLLFATRLSGTHSGDLTLPNLPIIAPTGIKIAFPNRHLEHIVDGDAITAITADFSPNSLAELLAQLGMELP
jgi:hypothetical protein